MSFRTHLSVLSCTAVLAASAFVAGCGSYGDGGHDYYSRHDYRDYRDGDYAAYRQDVNKERGDRNTIISDKVDDGRINGSARSYEERKASRAADEGVPGAAREERELRRERLYGR